MQPLRESLASVEPTERARAARRAWRLALVAYLVPVSVATHWPRLGFAGAGTIDKFVHFLAFGTLAWLWMHTKPWGRASLGWLFAAAWVFVDERTQALEILGRTFSIHDMIAGWLGVALAGSLYWLRRERTPAGTDARADAELAHDIAYASGFAWMMAAVVTLVVVVAIGGIMIAARWFKGEEIAFGHFVYAAGYAGFIGVAIAGFGVDTFGAGYARIARGGSLVVAPREAMPFWRAGFGLAAMAFLLIGYEVLLLAVFGREPGEELRTDHEGFVVLRQGYLIAVLLIAIAVSSTVGARAAFRANPSLATRR